MTREQLEEIYFNYYANHIQELNRQYHEMVDSLKKTGKTQYITNIDIKDRFNIGGYLNHWFFLDSLCPISLGGGVIMGM